jgi:hypothetical protein
MNAPQGIESLIQKTRRYEFLDGLRDMQFGIFFLILGLINWLAYQPVWIVFLIRLKESTGSFGTVLAFILLFGIPVLILFGVRGLMNLIRQRWLWKESGSVKPLNNIMTRRDLFISAGILLIGLLLGAWLNTLADTHELFFWNALWVSVSWSFGYTLLRLGQIVRMARYVWLGILGAVLSTILLFLPLGVTMPILLISLGWGSALIISGFIILRQNWPMVKE